jgi:histidinol phosphatase-like enzyme (inositol monophosphatase family)
MSDAQRYLRAVADVAKLAGDFALSHFGTGIDVIVKGDGSPVTIADRGAEQAARAWIERRFPEDGIVGEEFGTVRSEAKRRWIIDPIDGTKSFIRSVPLWGTLVAVAEGNAVIAGCAYFPVVRELVAAATGQGCFLNGSRCSVSSVNSVAEATVLTTDARFPEHPERGQRWNRLARSASIARTWGDCYGYLMVATGRAEVMVDAIVSQWDTAALYPIITEAGGVFTDWKGTATALGGNAIATNAALDREARTILLDPL